jgi:hypothetical protein
MLAKPWTCPDGSTDADGKQARADGPHTALVTSTLSEKHLDVAIMPGAEDVHQWAQPAVSG